MMISGKYFFFLLLLLAASCTDPVKDPGYEFMPDMYRSSSYETYSPNPNFFDGMTARTPVQGTIPRGFSPYPYPDTKEGYEQAGSELHNPLTAAPENLAEGKRLYEIFCSHCHGAGGKGDGAVVQRGFPPPPPYSGLLLKNLPEGKLFHSVTYGKNLMGSHASQINSDERWKVVMYVQTLQGNADASAGETQMPGAGETQMPGAKKNN